jgi:hypothetical protein
MVTNATGLWDVSDYGSTPIFCAGQKGKVFIEKKDRDILKKLANSVREISDRPQEEEKRNLWMKHNMLVTRRPVIFCDPENGWNEIITSDMFECSGELARKWEMVLKKEISWAEYIKDDKVIEPNFDVGYTFTDNGWGLETEFQGGGGGSYVWDNPVKVKEDIEKIKYPEIYIDYKTTGETVELADELFGELLRVRLIGRWWWTLGLTMDLAFFRGLENIMWDMIDNQEMIHRLMKILSDGTLKKLDFLEKNGLLSSNVDRYVGSGGFGYTEELTVTNAEHGSVGLQDMWGFGESQETGSVSPQMFEELIFQYQLPILKKFGLNCYGCCEPLDSRWHIVKRIQNLRRVSISPWSDLAKMTENLQDNYIFSMKPTPADLAVPEIDKDALRKKIRSALKVTEGCVLEIIMKDNHTLGNNPDNLVNWVKIIREEIEKTSKY